jgi:single-strand DNA-binding protein
MNHVSLSGYISSEPKTERRESGGKKTVITKFVLAVKRIYAKKGEPNADFIGITCFNKQAEFVEKYLQKGRKVIVEGAIRADRYKDKDGVTKYTVSINAQMIEPCDGKRDENEIQDTAAYVSSYMDISGLEGADYYAENPNA